MPRIQRLERLANRKPAKATNKQKNQKTKKTTTHFKKEKIKRPIRMHRFSGHSTGTTTSIDACHKLLTSAKHCIDSKTFSFPRRRTSAGSLRPSSIFSPGVGFGIPAFSRLPAGVEGGPYGRNGPGSIPGADVCRPEMRRSRVRTLGKDIIINVP